VPIFDTEDPFDDIQNYYENLSSAQKTALLHYLASLRRTRLCQAAFKHEEKLIVLNLRSSMYIHSIWCLLTITSEDRTPDGEQFVNSLDSALKNNNRSQIYRLLKLELKSKNLYPFLPRLADFFDEAYNSLLPPEKLLVDKLIRASKYKYLNDFFAKKALPSREEQKESLKLLKEEETNEETKRKILKILFRPLVAFLSRGTEKPALKVRRISNNPLTFF
jgi:hypothetical protein